MNKNKSWFIGITLGDGSLSGRMVRVWNNEEFIANRWIEILNKEFGISEDKVKIRKLKKDRSGFRRNKETIEATVNSAQFNREIKKLSREVLSSNDSEIIRSTLQGVFDAEGSICGRCEVVIWQRKNEQGNIIMGFVKKNLELLDIKFVDDSNDNFNIIRILGGFRNKENIKRFAELINFSHPKKKEWLNLDLEILELSKKISEGEIINFLKTVKEVTVNDIVRHFKVIETRVRRKLKKLLKNGIIQRSNTRPMKFSLRKLI